jgi:hypothetical protein
MTHDGLAFIWCQAWVTENQRIDKHLALIIHAAKKARFHARVFDVYVEGLTYTTCSEPEDLRLLIEYSLHYCITVDTPEDVPYHVPEYVLTLREHARATWAAQKSNQIQSQIGSLSFIKILRLAHPRFPPSGALRWTMHHEVASNVSLIDGLYVSHGRPECPSPSFEHSGLTEIVLRSV